MPRYVIFWAILLICCGYALLKGRKYERLAAVLFLTATVLSFLTHMYLRAGYAVINAGEVAVDAAVLVALIAIALASDRFWPLWAAGFQLVGSMAHVLKMIDVTFAPWGYAVAARFWSYPILLVLFIGVWRQHRRSIAARKPVSG
jgi:urea transporter